MVESKIAKLVYDQYSPEIEIFVYLKHTQQNKFVIAKQFPEADDLEELNEADDSEQD